MTELKITENWTVEVSNVYRSMFKSLKETIGEQRVLDFLGASYDQFSGNAEFFGLSDRWLTINALDDTFTHFKDEYLDNASLSDNNHNYFFAYFMFNDLLSDIDVEKRFDEIGHHLEAIKSVLLDKKRMKNRETWFEWYKQQKPEDKLLYSDWYDKYVKEGK